MPCCLILLLYTVVANGASGAKSTASDCLVMWCHKKWHVDQLKVLCTKFSMLHSDYIHAIVFQMKKFWMCSPSQLRAVLCCVRTSFLHGSASVCIMEHSAFFIPVSIVHFHLKMVSSLSELLYCDDIPCKCCTQGLLLTVLAELLHMKVARFCVQLNHSFTA